MIAGGEEEQQNQVLPSQVEEEHPTEMTLMGRRTGCAKRAWHRNAWPGVGEQRTNREVQSEPRGRTAAVVTN